MLLLFILYWLFGFFLFNNAAIFVILLMQYIFELVNTSDIKRLLRYCNIKWFIIK
jgi:hypothetical protein